MAAGTPKQRMTVAVTGPTGEIGKPFMRALEHETEESVNLAIFDDGYVVYVAAVQGTNPIRAFIRVGDRRPSYCTATGKVRRTNL